MRGVWPIAADAGPWAFSVGAGCVRSALPLALRLFWLLAAIVHLPALLRPWQAGWGAQTPTSSAARCAGLTLALLFCGLKAFDVRFLRTRPGLRSKLALLLVLILIHAGIAGGLDRSNPDLRAWLAVAGSVTLLCQQIGRPVLSWLRGFVAAQARPPQPFRVRTWLGALGKRDCVQFALTGRAPRAPPIAIFILN